MMQITFDYLYAHERRTPEEQRRFLIGSGSERVTADTIRRTYGGGNSRSTRGRSRTRDVPYRLVEVPRVDWQWLDARAGVTLFWRDPRGRAYDGFAADLEVEEPDTGSGAFVVVVLTIQVVNAGTDEELESAA